MLDHRSEAHLAGGATPDPVARATGLPESRHKDVHEETKRLLSQMALRDSSTAYIILYILQILQDLLRRYVLTIPMMATICTAVGLIVLWFIIYYSIEAIAS